MPENMKLTKDQIQKLAKSGFFTVTYTVVCELCGTEITGKTNKELKERLNVHLDIFCEVAKFLRTFKQGTMMKEIDRYLTLLDKIARGKNKINKNEVDEFLELGNRILKKP